MSAGLYVHVPFCLRKCLYCDFESVTALERIPDYLDALEREARRRGREVEAVDTVYVGGGTPSVLGPARIAHLLAMVRAVFSPATGAEVTVELNPDDVTVELLDALEAAGATRLSLGVQSFDDAALRLLGRRHDAAGARRALELVRRRRWSNRPEMSLDLMFGWRGQREEDHGRSLEEALAFGPEHLSCYQLTIEGHGSRFAARLAAGDDLRADEAAQRRLFLLTHEVLTARGYEHYEISNFARPGCRSRHNERYWSHGPYLGLGPAAHSFDGRRRRSWNAPTLDAYLAGEAGGAEELDDEQLLLERLMLGFRTARGVDEAVLAALPGWEREADRLVAAGLCVREAGRLGPTVEGMLVADALPLGCVGA